MTKKKVLVIVAIVFAVILAVVGILYYRYINRFTYNKEGEVGNTTGNLYNEGMFCAYKGYVYFSNPEDNGRLYRMREDGSDCERISTDSVAYINICNDYIYYVRNNMVGDITFVSLDLLNGISRLKIGSSDSVVMHQGISNGLLLTGNDLYFRAYNSDGSYSQYKVGIDGEKEEKLFDEGYLMLDYDDGKLYFSNVGNDHNLMYYAMDSGSVSQCFAGNIYMPDCENGYIYFIDLANGHKLSRVDTTSLETEVLCDDYVVRYNLNSATGEIYYQAENTKDDHKLCKMNIDGSQQKTVMNGDFTDINFTKEYVYFYELMGKSKYTLYRATLDGGVPDVFVPKVED